MCFYMNSAKIQRVYVNSAENQLRSALNRMNSTQKQAFLSMARLFQRENHRKTLKSARDRRYYQRHKDKILAKQKLKTAIYNKVVQHS